MATKSAPTKPPARRRPAVARPVYHEVQPGGTTRGNPQREPTVRGEEQGLGATAWIVIALIALLLVDTFAWDGFYRHAVWVAMNGQGESVRAWSQEVWM